MKNHEQVMKQALEALVAAYQGKDKQGQVTEAITALKAALAEPVQEPVAWRTFDGEGGYDYWAYEDNENYHEEYVKRNGEKYASWVEPLYTAPPIHKSLSITDLQEALVYTCIIDQDAIDDPDEYDEGSTLAQIDELHRIIHRHIES